jgi:hypothetical protein
VRVNGDFLSDGGYNPAARQFVRVDWDEPISDGGAPIIAYEVYVNKKL